jgi:hypothetical protein
MSRSSLIALSLLASLGACAVDDKDDISNVPFDLATEGKDDSARLPTKGVDLRVGQLGEGKFTATVGFVGHDIELTAGTVDIDLTGLDDNSGRPLDTILYVYGPQSANGHYPSQPLAFNDDMDPGVNLGSHIVLRVPAAGHYRLVASTYDNWQRYPRHVSRGSYRLITKCQDATWGACGPAISDLGGACWADADCLSATGAPLHCEGEITCAPGTECLFVRQGTCAADIAWMTYAPHQCGNPWSTVDVGEAEAERFPDPELAQVVAFAANQGIALEEVGKLGPTNPGIACLACPCLRSDRIFVKLSTPDAAKLAEQGWIYSSTLPEAVSLAPQQCGSNPWQTEPTTDVGAELEQVDTWLTGMNATVNLRGFTYRVEPTFVCDACSCPRGDRLVAFPTDAESAGLLASQGFSAIYPN